MNFIGMDIHKQTTTAVAKDIQGNILNEARFDNSKENFKSFLLEFKPEETKIVIESTCVWEYIYDLLESEGYSIKLANPMKTKAIAYARIKTDSVDASTLADLLRANLVSESYIPTKEIRNLRDVVRQRTSLIKERTRIKNKIHAIMMKHGMKVPFKTLCNSALKMILEDIKEISIKTILASYIGLLERYNYEISFIDEKIKDISYKKEQTKLLMTIPGIGSIRALELMSEIADINRFEDASKLCSYAGLVPSIKQSGNSLRFGSLIKQSSKTLKHVLIEASWNIVRTKESNQLHPKK
ncbi:MAG: IS110 family transposase [Candidatus Pacearchaeota archaeon]|nr:IS110 family transposase [Candidatus Pacearchaeota archaeon]